MSKADDRVALGGISTVGMVSIIEASDAMLKAANVTIQEFHDYG